MVYCLSDLQVSSRYNKRTKPSRVLPHPQYKCFKCSKQRGVPHMHSKPADMEIDAGTAGTPAEPHEPK